MDALTVGTDVDDLGCLDDAADVAGDTDDLEPGDRLYLLARARPGSRGYRAVAQD